MNFGFIILAVLAFVLTVTLGLFVATGSWVFAGFTVILFIMFYSAVTNQMQR